MKTISFVIPVFNEEKRINITFSALNKLSLPGGLKLEKIVFVNDGSTDKTTALLKTYKDKSKLGEKIQIVNYKRNRGKGYAIKKGMLETVSDYTLFFDADMSTPLEELQKFMPYIEKNADVVVGTRKNHLSTVTKRQPLHREILGKCFTLLTQIVLNVIVTDFTCGFKLFAKKTVRPIFESSQVRGWGYDAEILFLANKYGFSIEEKSVTWANDERTKVKVYIAVPQTLLELCEIRYLHTFKPALTSFVAPQKAFILKLASFV
ncbi:MAG: dolichyl-phosphate beta-glucosyltransferase [Patescibacteria group bacterium]